MVLKVTYTLQSKCKTCFGGPRMVLQAHLKKHIIALGGWLLMYTSGPPRPYMQKTCDVAEMAILAKKNLRKKCVNRDKM